MVTQLNTAEVLGLIVAVSGAMIVLAALFGVMWMVLKLQSSATPPTDPLSQPEWAGPSLP